MSRFTKSDSYNTLKDARTGGFGLPAGTTAERDPAPNPGEIRWNTTTNRLEFYNGTSYSEVASNGNVTITKDSFTGDGSTAAYVLSITPIAPENILVFVGNVYQEPTVNYTLAGATLTFTSAPPLATNIVVLHGFDSTGNTLDPVPNSIDIEEDGSTILLNATNINFTGSVVVADDLDSTVTVDVKGLPIAGLTNQVLSKVDGTNYNVAWTTLLTGATNIVILSQAAYDALSPPDANTLYIIT